VRNALPNPFTAMPCRAMEHMLAIKAGYHMMKFARCKLPAMP
jgi:hypothetical protein